MKLTMETFKPALYNFRLDELAFYVTYCVFGIVWMDFLFFSWEVYPILNAVVALSLSFYVLFNVR